MEKRKIIHDILDTRGYLNDISHDLYCLATKIEDEINNTLDLEKINNLDKFKRQLEENNLMSKELEEFIDNYIRYNNEEED